MKNWQLDIFMKRHFRMKNQISNSDYKFFILQRQTITSVVSWFFCPMCSDSLNFVYNHLTCILTQDCVTLFRCIEIHLQFFILLICHSFELFLDYLMMSCFVISNIFSCSVLTNYLCLSGVQGNYWLVSYIIIINMYYGWPFQNSVQVNEISNFLSVNKKQCFMHQ